MTGAVRPFDEVIAELKRTALSPERAAILSQVAVDVTTLATTALLDPQKAVTEGKEVAAQLANLSQVEAITVTNKVLEWAQTAIAAAVRGALTAATAG